jgi:hypothetical protein
VDENKPRELLGEALWLLYGGDGPTGCEECVAAEVHGYEAGCGCPFEELCPQAVTD